MTSANAERLRKAYDAFNRRDLGTVLEMCDDEVVIDMSRNIFNPDVYRGHDGVGRWVMETEGVWADFRATVEELVEVGDRIVARLRLTGAGRGSGVPAEMEVFPIFAFRDGKLLRIVGGFRDRALAVEIASAPELPDPVQSRHL